jgi:hypothetical protein
MSRKIKVVAVENVETVELPPPEPEVAAPEPEVAAPEPEVVVPEAVLEIENSSSDKPDVVADKATEAPKETKSKKKDEKMTCPVCNKTMLSKTYKYTSSTMQT